MVKTDIRKRMTTVLLKSFLILFVIIGLYDTFSASGFMGSGMTLLYYTVQSNIWIAGIVLVFLVCELAAWRTGKNYITNTLLLIKFVFTVAISLTFLVFAVLLAPLMPISYLLSPSNICLHNLTAILAIADFIVFDYRLVAKRKHVLLPTVMPLYYLCFALTLGAAGVRFNSNGDTFPYFFLNYKGFGWFRIGPNGIGVVYWIAMMLLIVLVTSWVLLKVVGRRAEKRKQSELISLSALHDDEPTNHGLLNPESPDPGLQIPGQSEALAQQDASAD